MGIKAMPSVMLRSFIHQKECHSSPFDLKNTPSVAANISIGQKRSFICSHVDSLIAENGAIHSGSPSHVYKKCSIVPASTVAANPKKLHKSTVFFIMHTPFFSSIFRNRVKYVLPICAAVMLKIIAAFFVRAFA